MCNLLIQTKTAAAAAAAAAASKTRIESKDKKKKENQIIFNVQNENDLYTKYESIQIKH